MLVGLDSLGASSYAADNDLDFSVPSSIQLAQAAGERAFFVMRAYPWDPLIADVVPVFASEEGKQPRVSTYAYPGVIRECLNVQTSILQADLASALVGSVTRAAIRVAVRRNEGDSDDFARYDWGARLVQIYRGYPSVPEDEWELVRTDKAARIRIDETGYWIECKDPSVDLHAPMQEATYAGTGGIEGDANLKDHKRPLCFGSGRGNITPRLIDRVYNVYQANDRQIRAVLKVYDKGLDEASGGLVPANGGANDIAPEQLGLLSVLDWSPIPGQWITDLTQGLIRLGSQPFGVVTADVQGYGAPVGSSDILFVQTVPHGTFDVESSLNEFDSIGSGWVDPIVMP